LWHFLTRRTIESQITESLRGESRKKRDPEVTELAHVLLLAAKGSKASSERRPEPRRLVEGLIAMTRASLEKLNS
jgi:hypothetical protein